MSGECEFSHPSYDYFYYDYDLYYDYDYAEEDKDQCLQSCLHKSKQSMKAMGCFFKQIYGHCIFLREGTVIGASGGPGAGTCWKFHLGTMFQKLNCPKIKLKFNENGLEIYVHIK